MEDLMIVASYICNRYSEEYGSRVDEMKLHKLLYFAQRESLVQNREPLFNAVFYGWKYGPIIKEIRSAYKDNLFYSMFLRMLFRICSLLWIKFLKNMQEKILGV